MAFSQSKIFLHNIINWLDVFVLWLILNKGFYPSAFQEKSKQISSVHVTFSYPNWAVFNLKTTQIVSEGVWTHFFI